MIQFWAQSLDNKSPDSFAADRPTNLVGEHDQHNRRAIVERVSRASRGELVGQLDGVVAHLAGSTFVIKAPCVEQDVAGRLAPLVGVGEVPKGDSARFASNAAKEFREFAATVGRHLLPDTVRAIESLATAVLEKKKTRTRTSLVIAGIVVALLALLLAFSRK